MSKYQQICTSLISEWNLNSPSAQLGLLKLIKELAQKHIDKIHTSEAKYVDQTFYLLIEADDITQTIMASFYDERTGRKLVRFDTPSQMLRRINTIVCHTIQDHARIMLAEKRGVINQIEASKRSAAMLNQPAYEDKSYELELRPSVLNKMDESQKLAYDVFIVKHIEGATLEEASQYFKMNIDEVRKNLKKAAGFLSSEYSKLLTV